MFLLYLVPHAVLHVISISIVFPQLLFVHAEMQDGKGLVHMPPSSKIDRFQVHKVSFTSISLHFCLGLGLLQMLSKGAETVGYSLSADTVAFL
jgi:hypothetical protein